MRYQEVLRLHSYRYQRRPTDIAKAASALGLVEIHAFLPAPAINRRFTSGFNELPTQQSVLRDEQLARDGKGLNPLPEAFPNTGYIGEGLRY